MPQAILQEAACFSVYDALPNTLFHLRKTGLVFTPILQMRKLRFKELKRLVTDVQPSIKDLPVQLDTGGF